MLVDDADRHPINELLGAYYLDALPIEQGDEIEHHLAACEDCRSTAGEVIELVAALALIEGERRQEVIDSFGALSHGGPPSAAFVKFAPKPVVKPSDDRIGNRIDDLAAVGPDIGPILRKSATAPRRPAARTTRERTGPPRTRRVRALTTTGSLFGIALLLAGLAMTALIGGPVNPPGREPFVTVAATGHAGAVSLSVVAGERDGAVDVQSTVNGLLPGVRYRLYAAMADGSTAPVVSWTGTGKAQDLSGRIERRLADIKFFTVTQLGKGAVVTVYLPPDMPAVSGSESASPR